MTQKQHFSSILHTEMEKDSKIYFLTADLGFDLWNKIKKDFPSRYFNVGASEQLLMGAAIGLALKGKTPIVYSITPFLIYRPFEWIRNYVNYENIPVKMVGSGRGKDYAHDGISHWAYDDVEFISKFKNIKTYYPANLVEVAHDTIDILYNTCPSYLNLSTK
jgi:transketolase